MKRYFMEVDWISPNGYYVAAEEDERGDWVAYEDVEKLENGLKFVLETIENCDCSEIRNNANLNTIITQIKELLQRE